MAVRHVEHRVVGHAPGELFELVADVRRYPEFLPWCQAARVRRRDGDVEFAELAIGFGPWRERFVSRVELKPAHPDGPRIDTTGIEGPFKKLVSHWVFRLHPGGTSIAFELEFEFRSMLLQHTVRLLFADAVKRMVAAFEVRAHQLYGKPTPRQVKPASSTP